MPSHDDRHLFELLVLEGAQAGLSWSTILHKREGYVARSPGSTSSGWRGSASATSSGCCGDAGIVRNRLKIGSAIDNARAVLALREERGSLADYLWEFVGGEPIVGRFASLARDPGRDRRVTHA